MPCIWSRKGGSLPGRLIGAAIGAAGLLGVSSALGWATMDPSSQLYGRAFVKRKDKAGRHLIALTYDDGPNDPHTGRLLDVLARHGVKATFFMIGRYAALRPDIVRKVGEAGHEIGNHTYSHPNLIFHTRSRMELELRFCGKALDDALGNHSIWFRPPFGARRPATMRAVDAVGLVPIMWSVSAKDWKLRTGAAIEHHVLKHVRGGDVILMHDGSHKAMGADRSATVNATNLLIPKLRQAGYRFVTIGEMLAD